MTATATLPTPPIQLGAGHLTDRIKQRFCPPEFSTLTNVEGDQGRFADAVAVNLWRSRGFAITGFEVKASRSDWLRELKDPAKAEACARYCHRFFLVANENVVKLEELPLGWGLMVPERSGLRIKRDATVNPHIVELSRSFAVHLIRRAAEGSADRGELRAAFDRGRLQGIEEAKKVDPVDRRIGKLEQELERYEKIHAEFKERTGVEISEWSSVDKLVKLHTLVDRTQHIEGSLGYTIDQLKNSAKQLEAVRREFLSPTPELRT